MDKENLEGLLIDYIDGRLGQSETAELEHILATDSHAKMLYNQLVQLNRVIEHASELSPSKKLAASFQHMLDEEQRAVAGNRGRQVFFSPMLSRVAAAIVLVMAGVTIGYFINQTNQQTEQLAKLEMEMRETRALMISKMDNQLSASQRMQGVNVAMNFETADDEVLRALARTMNSDPNTNVRLAAVEALGRFHEEPAVKKELISSLSTQSDPLVQIALIQLLVRIKEKAVINQLNEIIESDSSIKEVKDEAYTGILKLS
jgi:hypothetical protein